MYDTTTWGVLVLVFVFFVFSNDNL